MSDFPIIDAHVHTYRSREIGCQAMMGGGQTDYGGTVDELLELMHRAGIRKAVMVNMTPVVDMIDAALAKLPADLSSSQRAEAEDDIRRQMIGRLRRRNDWTCEVARQHPQLVAFISLDPSMSEEEIVAEIDLRRERGAGGIKLHPANQRFYPNDRRLWPVYDRAQALDLPIISHSGSFPLGQQTADHAHPKHFADILSAFPRLTLVMAHLAFGEFAACADLARAYPNLFFDCCGVINGTEKRPALSDEEATAVLRQVGTERVMFGSDYPWFDPVLDAARLRLLPLTDAEKRGILHDNAVRLLGL